MTRVLVAHLSLSKALRKKSAAPKLPDFSARPGAAAERQRRGRRDRSAARCAAHDTKRLHHRAGGLAARDDQTPHAGLHQARRHLRERLLDEFAGTSRPSFACTAFTSSGGALA